MRECGNVLACWNGVDNLFLFCLYFPLSVLSRKCSYIVVSYYLIIIIIIAKCRVLNSIIIIMDVHDANSKYLLYDEKTVVVDM